jgi:hypothetical protein
MTAKPLGVRLPEDVKAEIKQAATENRRSLNAEIVFRLEKSIQTKKPTAA